MDPTDPKIAQVVLQISLLDVRTPDVNLNTDEECMLKRVSSL